MCMPAFCLMLSPACSFSFKSPPYHLSMSLTLLSIHLAYARKRKKEGYYFLRKRKGSAYRNLGCSDPGEEGQQTCHCHPPTLIFSLHYHCILSSGEECSPILGSVIRGWTEAGVEGETKLVPPLPCVIPIILTVKTGRPAW